MYGLLEKEIKSIKTFISYNLMFLGLNSLFIKMDNKKAVIIASITYLINFIFFKYKNKKSG